MIFLNVILVIRHKIDYERANNNLIDLQEFEMIIFFLIKKSMSLKKVKVVMKEY